MLKMICDKCGADCDRIAYDVRVNVLHNPVPVVMTDSGEPKITCDNSRIRFLLCQNCYKQLGLPNIYKCVDKGEVVWRDEDESESGS